MATWSYELTFPTVWEMTFVTRVWPMVNILILMTWPYTINPYQSNFLTIAPMLLYPKPPHTQVEVGERSCRAFSGAVKLGLRSCGILWDFLGRQAAWNFQVVQKHLRYFSHQPRDGPVSARPQKILFGMFQLEAHMLSQAAMSGDDDAAVQDGVVAADETQESWRWGWYHSSILDRKARFVSTSYNVVFFQILWPMIQILNARRNLKLFFPLI